ncbi:MAG: hypothetical protein NZM11_00220 [Anaerolineales bacterium]|nr:hypothetical protein [Anaerolineales bacterium]
MKNSKLFDLYSDYLINAFGQTTATGLSSLLGGEVSHDQIQRMLAGRERTSADLWRIAKPHVRQMESADGVMIVDDSIAEKPYTDANDLICWHDDHSKQRNVKGIHFVTCLSHSRGVSLSVATSCEKPDSVSNMRSVISGLLRHKPTTSLRLCAVTSSLNCSKATRSSITLLSSQSCICVPSNPLLLPCENSNPLRWLRKVTGVWQILARTQDMAVRQSSRPPYLAPKIPFAKVQ